VIERLDTFAFVLFHSRSLDAVSDVDLCTTPVIT
jgi:hypothetical protein|tara:strand:+ start:571 stop:672 length:102 start_codon:yes stop_codon:yes gene_type:complete